jgi:hypothetical protein
MGRSDGVFRTEESQGLRTDHLIVDKTGLRVLWGVVVVCGEFLVVVGLLSVCRVDSSGRWELET